MLAKGLSEVIKQEFLGATKKYQSLLLNNTYKSFDNSIIDLIDSVFVTFKS
ncbi:hypothetical protein GW891_01230 [bacterium]|nr:hypothetical protein [bacterium]